jgi:hypothetical protein
MSTIGIVAAVAALFLASIFCLTRMVERLAAQVGATVAKAVNDVLNPPPLEISENSEPAIPPHLLTDGVIGEEQDYVPEWEREFEGTDW